ncbi:hypothetical protein COP1_008882 [Malus domestica]
MAKYKVPWILKWNYEVEIGEVYRLRSVKWWDKFNPQKIINMVLLEFSITQAPAIPAQPTMALSTIPEQSLSNITQQLMAEAALLHDEDSDFDASDASSQHPANLTSQKSQATYYQDSQNPYDI